MNTSIQEYLFSRSYEDPGGTESCITQMMMFDKLYLPTEQCYAYTKIILEFHLFLKMLWKNRSSKNDTDFL